jgi:hypothetical protein
MPVRTVEADRQPGLIATAQAQLSGSSTFTE